MALAGDGGKNIAKAFCRDGIRTRSGRPFSATVINYMLKNEVYAGTLAWTGTNRELIRIPNGHAALVSRDDFEKVQQLLQIDAQALGIRGLLQANIFSVRCSDVPNVMHL